MKTADELNVELLEEELRRVRHKKNWHHSVITTFAVLLMVAAAAVLIAMMVMPVLQIVGQSMTPTLNDGEIVLSLKNSQFEKGDVIAFYYNNKILIKRVIALPGEYVDIDEEGNVFVNSDLLDEPYLTEKAYGSCNIELPYQVPDGKIFVMGDHRATSADSRNTAVGCVAEEQIVGRVLFRIWPFSRFGEI